MLTTSELAKRYRVGRSTVLRWVKRDGMPCRVLRVNGQGAQRRFNPEIADAFLRDRPWLLELAGKEPLPS
jgi:excisionase family DNA binding protein